jgi:hypothetical protein
VGDDRAFCDMHRGEIYIRGMFGEFGRIVFASVFHNAKLFQAGQIFHS